jgi:DNA modification methylase
VTDIRFIKGDARHLPIEDESVQCIVTSPPYWGLRKYAGDQGEQPYGLEPTIEAYIATTIEVLRECRRVLRKDGVLFWNIGDSYHSGDKGGHPRPTTGKQETVRGTIKGLTVNRLWQRGLKPKDMCLIPQRVAIAAQADGWWVRSMIVWAKPNPMPESCKDRPTDAYEYIIMLTKAQRYFWNFDAVQEPCSASTHMRVSQDVAKQIGSQRVPGKTNGNMKAVVRGGVNPKAASIAAGDHHARPKQNESFSAAVCLPVLTRNMRNVWSFTTQGYREAHFATFPEELPRRCILAATKVGDTVLDPFAGSGTVGRVAIELNRKAILNDLAYHDLSEKRTKNVQRQLL